MKTHLPSALANIGVWIAVPILLSASNLKAAVLTDNFADRPIVTASTEVLTGNNEAATREEGEPPDGDSPRWQTVWGAWTAPTNGTVTITTSGSSFNTVLAVYVGDTVSHLFPVAQNDDVQSGFNWSSVSFPTKSGVTYSFAVDGAVNNLDGQGDVVVNISFTAPAQSQSSTEVGTDLFADRPTLASGLQAIGAADNRLTAGTEDGEPERSRRDHTMWWRWVAPANGFVTIDTLGSGFETFLTVYSGTALNALTEVALNDAISSSISQSRVGFQALTGQEYQICVDGAVNNLDGQGNIILNLSMTNNFDPGGTPGGDAFVNRGLMEGYNCMGVVNNTFFGADPGEPNHSTSPLRNQTAWWQWTAPADGLVDVNTQGSDFNTYLAVYTGTDVTSQQLITQNDNAFPNVAWSDLKFTAQRGVAYQIMVDGAVNNTTGQGNIALSVQQAVPPEDTLAIYPAVEVEIPGAQGVAYLLQSSPNLLSWQNVTNVVGAGQPIRILESGRNTQAKFYRYLAQP